MEWKESKPDYPPRKLVPATMHIAILYAVIDLGTQHWTYNKEPKSGTKISFTFEFPKVTDEFKGEVKPLVISPRPMTVTFGDRSNMCKLLCPWLGVTPDELKKIEPSSLVGRPAFINVIHTVSEKNGKTYANIATINPVPEGMEVPAMFNPATIYDTNDGANDIFDGLPSFIREKIEASDEFQRANCSSIEVDCSDNDDGPF